MSRFIASPLIKRRRAR